MKKLALLSLLAALATASFAQTTQTKQVTVTVADFISLTLDNSVPVIAITDGGGSTNQVAGGTYSTTFGFLTHNNVVSHVVSTNITASSFTSTVAAHASSNYTANGSIPVPGVVDGLVTTWLDGVTFSNSKANDGKTYNVVVTVAVG